MAVIVIAAGDGGERGWRHALPVTTLRLCGEMSPFPDVIDLLHQLVSIDSQNPDLVPGAPGEEAIARFCVDWLTQHGVESWLDEAAPERCNAVARVGSGDPVLTLCAHIDTVSIAGMERNGLDPYIEAGRLYGRGAYDMKGGVAAIMVALAELVKQPPRGTVMAALVCDEEFASIGAQDFVKRYRSDACIVTEPSEGRLILAHKGFVWAEIETEGVAAHGSRWQDGESAIAKMGRIVVAIDDFDRNVLRTRQQHALLGPASMHCGRIEGGAGWSTYAPSCSLRVERRTLPGETAAMVIDELRGLVREAGVNADVREVLARSPLECDRESRIARAVRFATHGATGQEPEDAGVAYWMDAAIFADAGVQTVDYGPTGAGGHAAVEWVDLESVEATARILIDAAHRYCSG